MTDRNTPRPTYRGDPAAEGIAASRADARRFAAQAANKQPPVRPALVAIARRLLGIQTLEVRGRDLLDFHEAHVLAIARALEAAFEAGRKSARRSRR